MPIASKAARVCQQTAGHAHRRIQGRINGRFPDERRRPVEEKESALKFLSGNWNLIGEAAEVRRTDVRSQILSALLIADEPMSPRDLAIATGMARNNIDQLLFKMAKANEVQKSGRGRYIHPTRAES